VTSFTLANDGAPPQQLKQEHQVSPSVRAEAKEGWEAFSRKPHI
jgi:hypothetical protein